MARTLMYTEEGKAREIAYLTTILRKTLANNKIRTIWLNLRDNWATSELVDPSALLKTQGDYNDAQNRGDKIALMIVEIGHR